MVALATPTTPSSFQLRWGLRCRRPLPGLTRVRSCVYGRCRWSCVVRAVGGGGEERAEQRSEGPVEDSYSGWFGEDSDGADGKKDYGGVIGVGVAGLFLAAGVMFASLSFCSKRQARAKQQIEPLTSQQEALLSTNDLKEEAGTVEEKSDMILPDENDGIQGIKSGTHGDHISSLKTAKSPSDSRLDDDTPELFQSVQETEFPAGVSDTTPSEDLQADPDSTVSHALGSNQSSSASLTLDSDDTYDLDDRSSNRASRKEDVVDGLNENSSANTTLTDLPSNSTDLVNLNSNLHEESRLSSENENYKSSGEVRGQFTSEPLDFNSCFDLETNATTDTQAGSNDASEVKDYYPHVQDTELGEKLQPRNEELQVGDNIRKNIPSGTISVSTLDQKEELVVLKETFTSALDQSSLGQSGLSEASSHSVLVNQYSDESQSYPHVETSRAQLLSKSMPPNSSFSHAGIPAPSVVSSSLQAPLGKVLVPAMVDQVQGQAFAALQVLKVIEGDIQPGDICTRREYARWLVSGSSALSRNTTSKVYPAMYIENVTELAFDDMTPDDRDYPYIQGLAEAGLISSKLSCSDVDDGKGEELGTMLFSPERPLSRQDLVSWKMALERRQLPEVDKKAFQECSGYIDIDKINADAWPAIVADLSSGENGIVSLAFGYTRLFQPEKPVTKAQAAVALSIGDAAEVVGEELTRIEAESLAETAVAAHTAQVAEVEKDLNASFEKELSVEREKIDAIEKLAEEAKAELEKLRKERDEENSSLIRGRAAVESEMVVLSRLRNEVEEQLQSLISNKTEIAFERDRVNKLRMETENENQVIVQLQYELEVERKALAMARAWAEDEAKRAREQAKALEEARERWERHGIKVIVDEELRESASDGVAFLSAGGQAPVEEGATRSEPLVERFKSMSQTLVEELKVRAENLVEKLKVLATKVKGKSAAVVQRIIQKILAVVVALKQQFSDASQKVSETQSVLVSRATKSMHEIKDSASAFGSGVKDGARRAVEDCKESMGKITQKFKT